MTVPYQFANATGNINLAELDANFDSLGVFSTNAATVTGNAQPNVTSLGTLVSLTATGNIRSVNGYLFGDGRFITNLPAANGTYGNANVATYLPTYTGSLSPNSVNSTNVTTSNLAVTNTGSFSRSVTVGQGLQVTGDINGYGNVIGKNFVSATGNANVVNVNANAISTVGLTATGLVNVATLVPNVITGNGNIFANFITANANLAVSGRITTNGVVIANQGFSTNGNINAGNVIATSFVGSGTQLTGINGPAFIATITTGQGLATSPLPTIIQQTLTFNNVSKNINNGYSVSNGIFTAPVAGFYQVSAACAVLPTNWGAVPSYYGAAVLGVYKNNTPIAAGSWVELKGAVINGVLLQAIVPSSVSTLVYLNAGDTLVCKLAYTTNAPTNFWNTYANVVPNYFQACWIRA
jgi:hypothetical protein